jgi:CHAT domain-containing protein/Tfp pilus assembly protein PilF
MKDAAAMRPRLQQALATALFCLGVAGAGLRAETSGPGVVVEEVGKGSALEGAGIRPGDLLFAWERPEGAGGIGTVFDWLWVRTEQAPRGSMRLYGEREGVPTFFEVSRGIWDARVRPRMTADLLQALTEGRQRIAAGDLEEGVTLWNRIVQSGEPRLKPWILLEAGEAWSQQGQSAKAQSALQTALAEARDPQIQVPLLEALGESYQYANEMARAEASFRSALEIGQTAWGESLQTARTIAKLGNVVRLRNRLDEAGQLQKRALRIRQRQAPDSLEVTDSLHQLFLVSWNRVDLEAMSQYTQRALAIQERWPPDSLAMADTLNDLALLAFEHHRYAESATTYQRALAILEQQSPESIQMATTLARLGLTAQFLGDFDSAADVLERALAIRERLAPESLGNATILHHLGNLARERGDLATAADFIQRALRIWRKASPEGYGMAEGLDDLGIVARMRGDLKEAWKLHSRALQVREQLPNRFDGVAFTLDRLGAVAAARGDLVLALDLYQRAHEIYQRSAPGTLREALLLQEIGLVYRRMRRLDRAEHFLSQAVDAMESQAERLGDSHDLQATFRASHEEIFRNAIEVALARGHTAEAFYLMERSRARSFLALLAERDLTFSGELPDALERSRRGNAARYDQALRELAQWTPKAGEEAREALHGELSRLRRERDEIAAEIRKASPRLAALRQPQPLDLAAARKVLDPGTLALSYSVGDNQTALFAVTREGTFRVKVLPVGEKRLHRDVERFLEQVRQPEAPIDLARSLYRELIGPVADLVGRSERVLILPDGPLHRLPFGALIRDTGARRQYLTEWKPLHTALSLTVYGALRSSRTATARPTQLVAFGDPLYPKELAAAGDAPVRRALGPGLRSFNWAALPYSRREVERIAKDYPEARLYLGEDATEERAKAVAHDARVLHFATHGYLDDRTPLDSALVLTIPEGLPEGRDNGLLQVWEIFESVRLDADLVVLSACESALGRELSGEGLIGLTRAFQYAGARSVVASLWSVSDQATAALMERFHRHYAAGLSKDEALRAAQIELIREPIRITTAEGRTVETDASAPFFWAAFQLFGDWR